jgi:sugar/nucleoside kinase (ribokinase family)
LGYFTGETVCIGGALSTIVYHVAEQGVKAYLVSTFRNDVDGYESRAELEHKGISDKYVSAVPALPTGPFVWEQSEDASARNLNTPAVGSGDIDGSCQCYLLRDVVAT